MPIRVDGKLSMVTVNGLVEVVGVDEVVVAVLEVDEAEVSCKPI